MFSVLEEAKKEGNSMLVAVLEGDPSIEDVFGTDKCQKFRSDVKRYEKDIEEALKNPSIHYMTNDERTEFLNLSAKMPTFA